jgi:hypothetical protein
MCRIRKFHNKERCMKKFNNLLCLFLMIQGHISYADDIQKPSFITRLHSKAKRALTYKNIKRSLTTPTMLKTMAASAAGILGLMVGRQWRKNRDIARNISDKQSMTLTNQDQSKDEEQEPWEKGLDRPLFSPRVALDHDLLKSTLDNGNSQNQHDQFEAIGNELKAQQSKRAGRNSSGSMSPIDPVDLSSPEDEQNQDHVSDKEENALIWESETESENDPVPNQGDDEDSEAWINEILAEHNNNQNNSSDDNDPIQNNNINDILARYGHTPISSFEILPSDEPTDESALPNKSTHAKKTTKLNKFGVLKGIQAQKTLEQLQNLFDNDKSSDTQLDETESSDYEEDSLPEHETTITLSKLAKPSMLPAKSNDQMSSMLHPIPYEGYMAYETFLKTIWFNVPVGVLARHHDELYEHYKNGNCLLYNLYCYKFMCISDDELLAQKNELIKAYKNKEDDFIKLLVNRHNYQKGLASHRGLPASQ